MKLHLLVLTTAALTSMFVAGKLCACQRNDYNGGDNHRTSAVCADMNKLTKFCGNNAYPEIFCMLNDQEAEDFSGRCGDEEPKCYDDNAVSDCHGMSKRQSEIDQQEQCEYLDMHNGRKVYGCTGIYGKHVYMSTEDLPGIRDKHINRFTQTQIAKSEVIDVPGDLKLGIDEAKEYCSRLGKSAIKAWNDHGSDWVWNEIQTVVNMILSNKISNWLGGEGSGCDTDNDVCVYVNGDIFTRDHNTQICSQAITKCVENCSNNCIPKNKACACDLNCNNQRMNEAMCFEGQKQGFCNKFIHDEL